MRKLILTLALLLGGLLASSAAALAGPWDDIVAKARGQTVYWNAWGGDPTTNDFIAWVGQSVLKRYGELVRAEVANTVGTPGDVEEELHYLFGS